MRARRRRPTADFALPLTRRSPGRPASGNAQRKTRVRVLGRQSISAEEIARRPNSHTRRANRCDADATPTCPWARASCETARVLHSPRSARLFLSVAVSVSVKRSAVSLRSRRRGCRNVSCSAANLRAGRKPLLPVPSLVVHRRFSALQKRKSSLRYHDTASRLASSMLARGRPLKCSENWRCPA